MRRIAGAAVAVCGLALVAACGQGPITAGVARGPESVRLGSYTQVFASALPAGQTQAQVVEGFREAQILWTRSEQSFRLVAPVRDYVTGQALNNLKAAMQSGQARDVVPAGTDRLFRTQVASITGSRAVITTCDDGSGFRDVNPRTRRVDLALASQPQQDYLAETWRMGLVGGHWAITGLTLASLPSPSAQRCQPGPAANAPQPPQMTVLLKDIAAALRDASSVHVSGTATQQGQTIGLDLSMTRSGLSGQASLGGIDVTVLTTGGSTYIKVNAAILRSAHAPSTACKLFCGKYLKATAAESGLTSLSMSSLMTSMSRSITSTPVAKITFGGTVLFNGVPAWVLEQPGQGTAYVAATGQHYLLRLVGLQRGGGTMNFTQWNSARIPGPPPASQMVNPTQLGGSQAA